MLDGRLAMAAQRLQGQAERPTAQEVVRVQPEDKLSAELLKALTAPPKEPAPGTGQ